MSSYGYDRTVHPGKHHSYRAQANGTEQCHCGATLYPANIDLRALINAGCTR